MIQRRDGFAACHAFPKFKAKFPIPVASLIAETWDKCSRK